MRRPRRKRADNAYRQRLRLTRRDGCPGSRGFELTHQFVDSPQVGFAAFVASCRGLAEFVPAGTADIAQAFQKEIALVLGEFEGHVFAHDFRRPLPGKTKSLMNRSPS